MPCRFTVPAVDGIRHPASLREAYTHLRRCSLARETDGGLHTIPDGGEGQNVIVSSCLLCTHVMTLLQQAHLHKYIYLYSPFLVANPHSHPFSFSYHLINCSHTRPHPPRRSLCPCRKGLRTTTAFWGCPAVPTALSVSTTLHTPKLAARPCSRPVFATPRTSPLFPFQSHPADHTSDCRMDHGRRSLPPGTRPRAGEPLQSHPALGGAVPSLEP